MECEYGHFTAGKVQNVNLCIKSKDFLTKRKTQVLLFSLLSFIISEKGQHNVAKKRILIKEKHHKNTLKYIYSIYTRQMIITSVSSIDCTFYLVFIEIFLLSKQVMCLSSPPFFLHFACSPSLSLTVCTDTKCCYPVNDTENAKAAHLHLHIPFVLNSSGV